jgi:hypothetical protein
MMINDLEDYIHTHLLKNWILQQDFSSLKYPSVVVASEQLPQWQPSKKKLSLHIFLKFKYFTLFFNNYIS